MSQTLTDRLTRGTYLFDNGPDKPAVICLSYTWMGDALKMLPFDAEKRVKLMLDALQKIYPKLDIAKHIIGDPITVSWESDPDFLGAFKGNLPGHYRYQRRMFCHFKEQEALPPAPARPLPRRRRHLLDGGLGRRRRAERAQRRLGRDALPRRRGAEGESGAGRSSMRKSSRWRCRINLLPVSRNLRSGNPALGR